MQTRREIIVSLPAFAAMGQPVNQPSTTSKEIGKKAASELSVLMGGEWVVKVDSDFVLIVRVS